VSAGPLVSICVPVRNGRDLIERALDSAVAQDYEPTEVVVVDDNSSDGTADLIQARFGDRVRLFRNDIAKGLCGNHNAVIERSRGELIKFLHHDDQLAPRCVSKMAEALLANPSAAIAFCRRAIELEDGSPEARRWLERYGAPHGHFRSLSAINDGSALFADWLGRGFPENWIGEPVAVMLRRSSLARVGVFDTHVRQAMDIDLWMRIIAHYDAAFIDEELATYRHSESSSTGRTTAAGANWLDGLWMLERLASDEELMDRHPELRSLRRARRREAFRTVTRNALRIPPDLSLARAWGVYARHRAKALATRA
jgi:glycosyltransferase involved in cell wall biosynthesis